MQVRGRLGVSNSGVFPPDGFCLVLECGWDLDPGRWWWWQGGDTATVTEVNKCAVYSKHGSQWWTEAWGQEGGYWEVEVKMKLWPDCGH